MSVKTVEVGVVYDHPEHGEVLVEQLYTAVEQWSRQNDRKEGTTFVRFFTEFDDYGGMHGQYSEPVREFADAVERVREHEYVEP